MEKEKVICKVCDHGELMRKSVHRMSGPVITIGYILLIPCVGGIALSLGFLIYINWVSARAVYQRDQNIKLEEVVMQEAVLSMEKAHVSQSIIDPIVAYSSLDERGVTIQGALNKFGAENLSQEQLAAIGGAIIIANSLHSFRTTPVPGIALFGWIDNFIILAAGFGCFIGGLLGWLLVMKKKILKCSHCGAVINAS